MVPCISTAGTVSPGCSSRSTAASGSVRAGPFQDCGGSGTQGRLPRSDGSVAKRAPRGSQERQATPCDDRRRLQRRCPAPLPSAPLIIVMALLSPRACK
jgi:hypothetical protein